MRGITMDGRLDTLGREAALDSLASVRFLTPLRPHVSETLLVSWDGSPMHTGPVRTVLAEGGTQQSPGEQLPSDAPDLNPGDGVGHPLKTVAMRQLCGANRVHLRGERGRAIKRWRRKPPVMTACFAEAGLSVETEVLHATLCRHSINERKVPIGTLFS
jgi:hypothetical protein